MEELSGEIEVHKRKKKETMKERIKRQDLYNDNTNLSQHIEFISKDMDIYD